MGFDNLYNKPENANLKIVFANDIAGSYEFDIFVVFKSTTEEKYYYASDSGCSCPIPFEDITEISHLTPIEIHNIVQFEQAASRHLEPSQIRDIRQAVFRAHYGRKQGETKRSVREREQTERIKELEELNEILFRTVEQLQSKLQKIRKVIGD